MSKWDIGPRQFLLQYTYPKVMAVNEHNRKGRRFGDSPAPFIQFFPIVTVQSYVFLLKFYAMVLEDLSNQFTSFKGCPHHTKAGCINHHPVKFQISQRLLERKQCSVNAFALTFLDFGMCAQFELTALGKPRIH